MESNERQLAGRHLIRAIRQQPSNVSAQFAFVQAIYELGNISSAIKQAKDGLKEDPTNKWSMVHLAFA